MPLYEYYCAKCQKNFESLLTVEESKDENYSPKCPKCGTKSSDKIVPLFRVGGRGDLRESTDFHGCHPYSGTDHHHDGHNHGHGHDQKTDTPPKDPNKKKTAS